MEFVSLAGRDGPMQSDIIPDAMPLHDENFSVAFTLPRLRDLFFLELKGAGIASGLDTCPPSDVSPEAYERLATEVEERFRTDVPEPSSPALAGPSRKRVARSPAIRCFFLAKAFLEACEYERHCAFVESFEDLVALQNEGNEVFKRFRLRRERLQSAIQALEIAPFPRKDWEPIIASWKEFHAALLSFPLPPESPVYIAPMTREKVFEECRNRVAALLDKTGLPPADIGPVFYGDYDQDPDHAWGRFKHWCCEARKKKYVL